jgi:hypothetical protein
LQIDFKCSPALTILTKILNIAAKEPGFTTRQSQAVGCCQKAIPDHYLSEDEEKALPEATPSG